MVGEEQGDRKEAHISMEDVIKVIRIPLITQHILELRKTQKELTENDPEKEKKTTEMLRRSIDLLVRTPNPEAINNLALLAGGYYHETFDRTRSNNDDFKAEATFFAIQGLHRLSKHPNWQRALQSAESVYPSLLILQPILQEGKFPSKGSNYRQYKRAQELYKAFAGESIETADQYQLAEEIATPFPEEAQFLLENGLITPKQASIISEAKKTTEELLMDENTKASFDANGKFLYDLDRSFQRIIIMVKRLSLSPRFMGTDTKRIIAQIPWAELINKCSQNQTLLKIATRSSASKAVEAGLSYEDLASIAQNAPLLNKDESATVVDVLLNEAFFLVKSPSELQFVNKLLGFHGNKIASSIIKGYGACVEAGFTTIEDKTLILELLNHFQTMSPNILKALKQAKTAGMENAFYAELRELSEKIAGAGKITDTERAKPFFVDLIEHVYPNNAGDYGETERIVSCEDRSGDLIKYTVRPRYDIDLLSVGDITCKDGEVIDQAVIERVKAPVLSVYMDAQDVDFDQERMKMSLKADLEMRLEHLAKTPFLQGINAKSLTTIEEQLFVVLLDSLYGSKATSIGDLKGLLNTYQFCIHESVKDYIEGTTDRVLNAPNQDYALLCELNTFYSDKIKETIGGIIEEAKKNPDIAGVMEGYFKSASQKAQQVQQKQQTDKAQLDKLGTNEGFLKQLQRTLQRRHGKKYTFDEIKRIIYRYEITAQSLAEESSTSESPTTRAFYGQLKSQRDRTFDVFSRISGIHVDPHNIHLGDINFEESKEIDKNIQEGAYHQDQFLAYTTQQLIDYYGEEKRDISIELGKFASVSGQGRNVLYGYITKTKESAFARRCGGVCVAGDNPQSFHPDDEFMEISERDAMEKESKNNLWDMPNYLQLVLIDPDTHRCQGLVLMHDYNEATPGVLHVSFNPSSTYLYRVDEETLFRGLMGTLEQFAKDNNFQKIIVSRNKQIRTNRVGGQFENALDTRIKEVNERITIPKQPFAFSPSYFVSGADVIWSNGFRS